MCTRQYYKIIIEIQVIVMFSILNSYYITLVTIDFVPLFILTMCYYRFGKDRHFSVTNIEYKHFMLPGFTDTCLFNKHTHKQKPPKKILACFSSAHVTENFIFSNKCQHENMLLPLLTEKNNITDS